MVLLPPGSVSLPSAMGPLDPLDGGEQEPPQLGAGLLGQLGGAQRPADVQQVRPGPDRASAPPGGAATQSLILFFMMVATVVTTTSVTLAVTFCEIFLGIFSDTNSV